MKAPNTIHYQKLVNENISDFLLCISCVICFSLLFVFFRDLEHLTVVVMQALFYLTPVIYPLSSIPEQYHTYFQYNPIFPIINIFQSILYSGVVPELKMWLYAIAVDLVLLLLALLSYRQYANKLAFRF